MFCAPENFQNSCSTGYWNFEYFICTVSCCASSNFNGILKLIFQSAPKKFWPTSPKDQFQEIFLFVQTRFMLISTIPNQFLLVTGIGLVAKGTAWYFRKSRMQLQKMWRKIFLASLSSTIQIISPSPKNLICNFIYIV